MFRSFLLSFIFCASGVHSSASDVDFVRATEIEFATEKFADNTTKFRFYFSTRVGNAAYYELKIKPYFSPEVEHFFFPERSIFGEIVFQQNVREPVVEDAFGGRMRLAGDLEVVTIAIQSFEAKFALQNLLKQGGFYIRLDLKVFDSRGYLNQKYVRIAYVFPSKQPERLTDSQLQDLNRPDFHWDAAPVLYVPVKILDLHGGKSISKTKDSLRNIWLRYCGIEVVVVDYLWFNQHPFSSGVGVAMNRCFVPEWIRALRILQGGQAGKGRNEGSDFIPVIAAGNVGSAAGIEWNLTYGWGDVLRRELHELKEPNLINYNVVRARALWTVLSHEIGHALGLDHTWDAGHLMFPFANSKPFRLDWEDCQTARKAVLERFEQPRLQNIFVDD